MPLLVLFQHPSPGKEGDNRSILRSTFLECIQAQRAKTVESIHFVYDVASNARGTSWKSNELYNLVQRMCEGDIQHRLTVPSTISEKPDICVCHPIFGEALRRGWASMKKGTEMSFSIFYRENLDP